MTGSIVIACPNLSLDRTMLVDRVSIGSVHRSVEADVRGGGKGVNIARALSRMNGGDAVVVGIAAGHTGRAVLGLLADEGITTGAIECPGETRSCLTVVSEDRVTVFNEEGPFVDDRHWRDYEDSVISLLDRAAGRPRPDRSSPGVFVCSGSFPPGAPAEGAARLVTAARAAGYLSICDTSGEQLAAALGARPDLVKPNLPEAEAVLGAGGDEPVDPGDDALERALAAAERLIERGPRAVVVSAGSAGASLVDSEKGMTWGAAPVKVVNPVGAGDCLVAGYVIGQRRGNSRSDSVALGLAMAGASCETFYAGDLLAERARDLQAAYFADAERGR